MSRASNPQLCASFRSLLTTGFYASDADGVVLEGPALAEALASTKAWRGEMWRAFRAMEDRLCPVQAFEQGRGT